MSKNISQNIADVEINELGVRKRGQRRQVQTINKDKTMTKQADFEKANIHCVLKKYQKTGLLPQRTVEPLQGTLPNVESYHDAMNVLTEAQQSFDALPSDLRDKFENNPAKFLEFVTNADNLDEMVELGLAEKVIDVGDINTPSSPAEQEAATAADVEAGTAETGATEGSVA